MAPSSRNTKSDPPIKSSGSHQKVTKRRRYQRRNSKTAAMLTTDCEFVSGGYDSTANRMFPTNIANRLPWSFGVSVTSLSFDTNALVKIDNKNEDHCSGIASRMKTMESNEHAGSTSECHKIWEGNSAGMSSHSCEKKTGGTLKARAASLVSISLREKIDT
jgi:hypothetical protein